MFESHFLLWSHSCLIFDGVMLPRIVLICVRWFKVVVQHFLEKETKYLAHWQESKNIFKLLMKIQISWRIGRNTISKRKWKFILWTVFEFLSTASGALLYAHVYQNVLLDSYFCSSLIFAIDYWNFAHANYNIFKCLALCQNNQNMSKSSTILKGP